MALLIAPLLDPATHAGVIALAIAPAPLLASTLVRLAGGRSDMTGALALGTAVVSFALVALRPDTGAVALLGAQAFGAGALIGNALPTVRDRLLVPLRWTGDLAALAVLGAAFSLAPVVDVGAGAIAILAFIVPVSVALLVALALGRDRLSALAGAGGRDPVLAIPIAWSMQGPAAAAVPLLYAPVLIVLSIAILRRR